MTLRERSRPWWRPVMTGVGLLVAYYAFPARQQENLVIVAELLLTLGGLVLLSVMVVRETMQLQRGESQRSTPALVIILMLVVVSFAFAFYVLDQTSPGQVAGLSTRTDALYFTVSTMTTVGYGDVHAAGQLARVLTVMLIVFNVVVVAALLRNLTTRRAEELAPPG